MSDSTHLRLNAMTLASQETNAAHASWCFQAPTQHFPQTCVSHAMSPESHDGWNPKDQRLDPPIEGVNETVLRKGCVLKIASF